MINKETPFHKIEIDVNEVSHGMVKLDGNPIMARAVKFEASVGELTCVTITLAACEVSVIGDVGALHYEIADGCPLTADSTRPDKCPQSDPTDHPWCMCEALESVARDGYSTCSICGGKDAYGKSELRPPDQKKTTLFLRKPMEATDD